MGAVEQTSTALVAVMEGDPIPREADLARFVVGDQGTPNQRYMAAAALLRAQDSGLRAAAVRELEAKLLREESDGPAAWEVLCPAPHDGMYCFAWVGVIAAGQALPEYRRLGERAAVILGQALRLGDLVATPDGDLRGLPGMRAPNGDGLVRPSLSACWVEVRSRQPGGRALVQRGAGGRPRKLAWTPTSDPLIDGAACWLRTILDGPGGKALLDGPLSQTAALPKRIRLPLRVWRWNGGSLAYFADPGPERRGAYVIRGSAAAKRGGGAENPVSWVLVEWGPPAKHHVRAGSTWETPPPEIVPGTAVLTSIAGVDPAEFDAPRATSSQEPPISPPATDHGPATDGAQETAPAPPPRPKKRHFWEFWK